MWMVAYCSVLHATAVHHLHDATTGCLIKSKKYLKCKVESTILNLVKSSRHWLPQRKSLNHQKYMAHYHETLCTQSYDDELCSSLEDKSKTQNDLCVLILCYTTSDDLCVLTLPLFDTTSTVSTTRRCGSILNRQIIYRYIKSIMVHKKNITI